jgi:DNA polymerase-3 subunit gamma/tau
MYQVIARKYRPQSFGELIGQEPVRTTLENAIRSNRLAHGYIFAGQRGTGKTTVARILARCLNCIEGPTVQPCGICASCVEIAAGNSPDVIEIDAASNRGINEMRELRDNVRYRPARDRYKVFIIDEAHQITNEAFNALLKTLEEPPEWAVFILCTTEVHKIPNTIGSRCQQFSFRSVEFAELMERMEFIAKEEGIEADPDALAVIAQAGEGSVRDSLSALDQAIACCGKVLKVETVRGLLGMFGAESLKAVAEAVRDENGERMLEIVQELEHNGQNIQHYCRELARYWRNLLVARIAGKTTRLIPASDREQQAMLETARQFSEEDLTRYLQLTLDLYKTLQSSLQPRFHMELGLIKLVQAGKLEAIEEALAGIPETPVAPLRASAPAPRSEIARLAPAVTKSSPAAPPKPVPPAVPPMPSRSAAENSNPLPDTSNASPGEKSGDLKRDLLSALLDSGLKMSADAVQHSHVSVEGAELVFTTAKRFMLALRDAAVAKAASGLLGKPVKVRVEIDAAMSAAGAPAIENGAPAADIENEATQRALTHPGVKRFQELFPGAHVRSVRNLNE